MPRPGPRPYECVRRAWHSDRHQPIRGSIIQQIFRVVHERHTSATKKNKEWQAKLPFVVLKAEEIMYSKANSEAEYTDAETLWDRVNEAINMIIRRDETTETGELLPPCVEAALNLGCVPVRASRSQRHNNPRSYLSPRTQELDSTTSKRSPTLLPLHSAKQSTNERPSALHPTQFVSESNRHMVQHNLNHPTISGSFPSPYDKFPSLGNSHFISGENSSAVNATCIYPLHYGTHLQPNSSRLGFQSQSHSNTVIVGTPIFPSISEGAELGCLQNLFPSDGDENVLRRITQADGREKHEKAPASTECDLSLRLGPFSDRCLDRGKGSACVTDDICPSSSQKECKFSNPSPPQTKEFSFFPVNTTYDPFEFCASNCNCEGEGQTVEATVRKRKVSFDNNVEGGQFFYQQEPNQFTGRVKRPGL